MQRFAPLSFSSSRTDLLLPRRWLAPLALVALLLGLSSQHAILAEGDEPVDPRQVERAERSLDNGLEALAQGRYSTARRNLRRVTRALARDERLISPEEQARLHVALAQTESEQGEFEDALETLEQPLAQWREGATHLLPVAFEAARLAHTLGRFEQAEGLLEALLEQDAKHPQALVLSGLLHRERGERERAIARFEAALDVQNNHSARFDGEGWLVSRRWQAIGEAWYYLDLTRRRPSIQQAIRAFTRARRADPTNYAAQVWGGDLSLEAEQQADARRRWYREVVDRNPNYVPARAGIARTYYFEWQSMRGREEARLAERVSERHFETKLVMAEAFVNDQRYDRAVPYIDALLERNPRHLHALSVRALLHLYHGEREEFEALEERVLELNPAYSDFYAILAEGMMTQHRFGKALRMAAKGLEVDERDWTIHRTIGMTYARMGQTEKASEYLTQANSNDAVRNSLYTINMLQALRVIERTFREHETEEGRFVIRTHQGESRWLMPLIERHLQKAWEAQTEKYGFEPETPIVVEVFHRRDDFAARSVALPNLPALGVCFGQYITMLSPTALDPGSFSWARTLRHEMDHVFQIQASDGRVPRWLAEGLSVYEERLTRPEWGREMDQQMIQFYHQDRLLRMANINAGFRSMGLVMFAYYQSSYMVEFIVEELSDGEFAPIVRMLEMFGEDRTVVEIFDEVLEMELDAFDEAFREYVHRAFIEPNELMAYFGTDDLQRFRLAYEDNPEDVDLAARLAAALLHNGSLDDARNFAGRALRMDRNHPKANKIWGHVQYRIGTRGGGDRDALQRAWEAYQRCLELEVADFWVYLRLGELAAQRGQTRQATRYYRMARESFPRYVGPGNPYMALAQLYQQQGNATAAREMIQAYVAIVETDIQNRQQLMTYYRRRGERETAMRYLKEILHVDPTHPQLHIQLAEDYLAFERYDDAVFAYRVALGFRDEEHEIAAATGLIEALRMAERYDEAIEEIERRQRNEPERFRWRRLRERVEASRAGEEDLPRHPDAEVRSEPSDHDEQEDEEREDREERDQDDDQEF